MPVNARGWFFKKNVFEPGKERERENFVSLKTTFVTSSIYSIFTSSLSISQNFDISNSGFSMDPQHQLHSPTLEPDPKLSTIKIHHPASPRLSSAATPIATPTPTAGSRRKIGVAVDLSEESAYAVRWAVQNYIRPDDAVILLHVSPTSVLFGADWGSIEITLYNPSDNPDDQDAENRTERSKRKLEDDFDAFTSSKAADLAKPLKDAQIPYKIHIVKDHDMRERLCLEVERLGLNALIMGSRGFGAAKRGNDGGLGSVSDYCVNHCACPVVVVRFLGEKYAGIGSGSVAVTKKDDDAQKKVCS